MPKGFSNVLKGFSNGIANEAYLRPRHQKGPDTHLSILRTVAKRVMMVGAPALRRPRCAPGPNHSALTARPGPSGSQVRAADSNPGRNKLIQGRAKGVARTNVNLT